MSGHRQDVAIGEGYDARIPAPSTGRVGRSGWLAGIAIQRRNPVPPTMPWLVGPAGLLAGEGVVVVVKQQAWPGGWLDGWPALCATNGEQSSVSEECMAAAEKIRGR